MQRLLPSLEFARRHLAERITVGDLAKKVGLSIPQFHAEFKKAYGESPSVYRQTIGNGHSLY